MLRCLVSQKHYSSYKLILHIVTAKYDPPSRKSPDSKNSDCNVSTKSNHIKRYDLSSLKLNMCGLRTDEDNKSLSRNFEKTRMCFRVEYKKNDTPEGYYFDQKMSHLSEKDCLTRIPIRTKKDIFIDKNSETTFNEQQSPPKALNRSDNTQMNFITSKNSVQLFNFPEKKTSDSMNHGDSAPSKWNQRHSLKCFQKEDTYAESNQCSENGTYVIERSQRSVRNCSKNSSGHSKTLMNVSSYHETEENDYAMSTSDISCEGNETDEDESYEDNEREAYNKEKRHIRNNFDNYSNNELNHSSISSVDKFKEERVVQDPQPFKSTKDNILEKYMTSKDSSNNLNTRISSSKCSGQFSIESLSQPETLLVNFHSKNNGDQMNESRRCSNNDSRRVRNQSPDCSDGLSNSHLIFSCVQRENFSVQKKKKTNEKFQHSRFTTIPPSSNNKTSVLSEENENLTSHILAQHFNSRHEEGGEPFKIALTNNDQQYNLNMNTNRSKEFKRTLSKCDERNFNQTEGVIVLFENKTAFNEMERVEIEKPIFKHVSMKRVSIKEYYKKTLYQPVTIHLTKYDIESGKANELKEDMTKLNKGFKAL